MRILLIDDSVAYQEEFSELLAECELGGTQLDCITDAAVGAQVMNRGEHTLYFVDYRLPGSSGIDLILGARQAGVNRPIICLTGFDNRKLDLAAEQAGASAYLTKGDFSPVSLSRTIRYALRNMTLIQMPREAESRFGLAQEAVCIGTWEWDVVSDRLVWDSRMFQLFGCTSQDGLRAEAIWRRALHPATLAEVEQTMRASLASGKPFQTDFTILWDDGSVHYIRSAGRVLHDLAGQSVRMIGITWDITEVRKLVADLAVAQATAEQATAAKSRFLAGVSHELRTPLNGILGYAHLLRLEGGLSAGQTARVESMLMAGAHLLDMINRVLDLSAIETAGCELRAAEVDPRALIEECLELVRPSASAKALGLAVRIAPDFPSFVTTDPTRLRQVLLNLLGNAVKFTPSGQVDVLMTKSEETAWRIEVADTGPGISAEDGRRLFQDFQRLHALATPSIEGAGLGLALAGRLAVLLGGRLSYRDNPGGGSRFCLDLPYDLNSGFERTACPPVRAAPPDRNRALRILVVDDLPMNRELAEAFLRTGQHEVMCAADGAQAVAAATAETFDVILMDVCMPGMDGLEATRRIRALGGAAGAVPIVALTAHAFVEQVEECGRAGMDGHVTKPFTPDALLSAVTRASTDKMPVSSVEPSPRHEDLMTGSTKPLFGAELPILQTDAFERTAACLPSDVLAGYLQTLVERSQALLGQLRAPDPPADQKPLTVAAHALAGSAGMFGFERLSVTARHFEHASIAHLPEVGHLTESLIAAAVDTVDEMNRRMAVCA